MPGYEKLHQYIISITVKGTLRFKFSSKDCLVCWQPNLWNVKNVKNFLLEMLIVSCNNKS